MNIDIDTAFLATTTMMMSPVLRRQMLSIRCSSNNNRSFYRRMLRTHTASAATATTSSNTDATTSTIPTLQVPPVDLSLPPAQVGKDLHEACTTVGFFHLLGHGVPETLRMQVLEEARYMFASLTPAQKGTFSVAHSNSYRGYQSVGVNITREQEDGHEGFDLVSESRRAIRDTPNNSDITNYGKNLWPQPDWMPSLRPTLDCYIHEMNSVGLRLLMVTSLGLGLGHTYFDKYFDDPYWSMRLIRYPPPPTYDMNKQQQYEYGVGTHTDYGVFTMILCDDVKNTLQIRPKSNNNGDAGDDNNTNNDVVDNNDSEWVTVDPIPGGFICNIGDMLARWTNGIYVSTPHRVLRPPSGVDRVSVPFFFDPSYDALIHPIDQLVQQSQRPPSFEPILYGDHLLAKTSKNFRL